MAKAECAQRVRPDGTTLVEHHSSPGETLCQAVKDIILGGERESDANASDARNLIVNPLGSVP